MSDVDGRFNWNRGRFKSNGSEILDEDLTWAVLYWSILIWEGKVVFTRKQRMNTDLMVTQYRRQE